MTGRGQGLIAIVGEPLGGARKLFEFSGLEALIDKLDIIYRSIELVCIEIQRTVDIDLIYEQALKHFAAKRNLLVVATNETYFERESDYEVYEIMRTISRQGHLKNAKSNYFKDYRDMLP